ncbi:hypothetical protein [Okeania sp. SIO2B3]|uniref:hypothetical protein n=1 Tax=Okeania sp. SIO2B3 TaxID=2607784 RepID=UPI0013BF0872|nr:hypothetical protein [Okeania sp. SIO2B3]NET40573.1 hypothetical protein [Okeania sp. SIO2B3]
MAQNPYAAENRLLYCNMKLGSTASVVKYGFPTNIDGTTLGALGLAVATEGTSNVLLPGVVIGCNAPKPFRATKDLAGTQGSESSFISDAQIATAKAAGWTIQAPKYKNPPRSARSKLVYIETKVGATNIPYGWAMPLYQYTAMTPAGLAELGITEIADTEVPIEKALFGLNAPKPGRARKAYQELAGASGGGTGVLSTFYSDASATTAANAGWTTKSKPQIIKGYVIP